MRIGELARQSGVSPDTIRFYERSGVLPRPSRAANAYRDYGPADLEHLQLVHELRRLGMPLQDSSRIASWCHTGHCGQTDAVLPQLIAERRREIVDRIASLAALDAHLEALERHLVHERRRLPLAPIGQGTACCSTADVVLGGSAGCAACGHPPD